MQHSARIPPCSRGGGGRDDCKCRLRGQACSQGPGILGERGGKAEAGGSDLLPGGPQHPLAPHNPGSPDSKPSPDPAAPHSPHRPRLLHAGPSQARAAGPGGTAGMGARGGVRAEPGPGVSPTAPLSVVPLFEIGAGGALRSRDGASPIGTGLSPGSGPERSASGGAAAAAGRAGKASPGLEGRREGCGDARTATSSLLCPVPDRPASVVDFLPGQRTPLPRLAIHSATPASPARLSPRGCVGSGSDPRLAVTCLRPAPVCGRLLPGPSPEVSRRSFVPSIYFNRETEPGAPPLGSPSDGEGAQNEINRSVEF